MSMLFDYTPVKGCTNPDTYGEICVKCNKCGRFTRKYQCVNCGKSTKIAFVQPKNWGAVEFYDKLRAPVCPDCKKFFGKELITNGWNHSVISGNFADFIKRG